MFEKSCSQLELAVNQDLRARLIDRQADNELAVGRHTAAERLSHQAQALREVLS